MNNYNKYLKYKTKYLDLINQTGSSSTGRSLISGLLKSQRFREDWRELNDAKSWKDMAPLQLQILCKHFNDNLLEALSDEFKQNIDELKRRLNIDHSIVLPKLLKLHNNLRIWEQSRLSTQKKRTVYLIIKKLFNIDIEDITDKMGGDSKMAQEALEKELENLRI